MQSLTTLYSWIKTKVGECGGSLRLVSQEAIDDLASTNSKISNEWMLTTKAIAPRVNDLADGQMDLELGLDGVWSTSGDVVRFARILTQSKAVFEALTGDSLPVGTLFLEVQEPAPCIERMGLTIVSYTVKVTISTSEVV